MGKKKYLYCAVTNDEYEFIIAVCDNYKELSKQMSRLVACLKQSVHRHLLDTLNNCYYIRVPLEEIEEKLNQIDDLDELEELK